MVDFLLVCKKQEKSGITIYPKFKIIKSSDLMIRGGDFYAVWLEEFNTWSTEEDDLINLIDSELQKACAEVKKTMPDVQVTVKYMWDADSGSIDKWHKYCTKQTRDNYHPLDETIIFSNTVPNKKTYSTKHLDYPLERGDISAWDSLISVLYEPEERHKIEWVIGSIVSGDSKKLQKFMVMYGSAGTGKSTILNVIEKLFNGYCATFDAKALGSANAQFALEPFRSNPLVAIQHDGDLSKIEDNTRLNSLVSHEPLTINEKFKATYSNSFKAFLFMGTNKPVKITDGKSGLLRRLIDVSPSGKKIPQKTYKKLMSQIDFELGAIAHHCLDIYLEDPDFYDTYIPVKMMGASNDFYNFVEYNYSIFNNPDGVTLKQAWNLYKEYCEYAHLSYSNSQRVFREELKNYFWNYEPVYTDVDGLTHRGLFTEFKTDIFNVITINSDKSNSEKSQEEKSDETFWLDFQERDNSIFDEYCKDCVAQYAKENGSPKDYWANVKTTLSDLDTHKLHYSKLQEHHIFIDFDIPDENGGKSYEKNVEAASKFPKTYAELSKSGAGIHLHYIYTGDVDKLQHLYSEHIEIKRGSVRRALTKCNDIPIATINSGLPLKGEKRTKMINYDSIKSEKGLRNMIMRNLKKEIHGATKPSVDFIYKILEDAYDSGLGYDVTDMRNAVYAFAANSTNQSDICMKLVGEMKFKSEEPSSYVEPKKDLLTFFDIEVFPNLFMVKYMDDIDDIKPSTLINPKPSEVESLFENALVGFNNRSYDNHMLYAAAMGYSNIQLYELSKRLINKDKQVSREAKFGEAYNLSYTDIYDFASANNKKSLKKLEIEMASITEDELRDRGYSEREIRIIKQGTHHQELGLPWDEPVPEDKWSLVADYCDNDVIAERAAFYYLKGDWIARQILADISGGSINDTTNTLSTKLIFGNNRKPQGEFNYRDLSKPVGSDRYGEYLDKFGSDYKFRVFNADGMPEYRDYIPGEVLPDGWSILPFFPGYKFDKYKNKSTYLGEDIGEGGRAYAEPGIYGNMWDADITGQHPSSIIAEMLFGKKYTKAYEDIVYGRVSIKHKAWEDIDDLFDGKLRPYIQMVIDGKLRTSDLANALKTVVNSVYGLTSAKFENPFRDPRNIDNIVAKRGALFMTLLKREVQKRGFIVAHIKTDSIKIPDATDEIKEFVINFGKEYGYSFETEAEFEKFCIVNDAVYVAKTKEGKWTATGTQFQIPYVFKTLFTHEDITFEDLCETKTTKVGALYLDMNEPRENELVTYEKDYKRINRELNRAIRKHADENDILDLENGLELYGQMIEECHNYIFIGRVGQFCPIKPGFNGGAMYYKNEAGKYLAVNGTKGYRWMESEVVRTLDYKNIIDTSYYDTLVKEAIDTISFYGDVDWFCSDEPYKGVTYDEQGRPVYLDFGKNYN